MAACCVVQPAALGRPRQRSRRPRMISSPTSSRDRRVRDQVVVPGRVGRSASLGGDHHVAVPVTRVDERDGARLSATGADGGEQQQRPADEWPAGCLAGVRSEVGDQVVVEPAHSAVLPRRAIQRLRVSTDVARRRVRSAHERTDPAATSPHGEPRRGGAGRHPDRAGAHLLRQPAAEHRHRRRRPGRSTSSHPASRWRRWA